MIRFHAVRIGFLLGVSLLLAAIIYFFAANWGGLGRMAKISLAAGLVLLFYGVSYVIPRFRALNGHQSFLSNIFLVAGCIAFGVAVTLLGQTYNSHADSYSLFLVWAVPALLLAWITRYNPFYLLTYTLVHLAIWFYFFPSDLPTAHSEPMKLVIGGSFFVLNVLLFVITETNRLKSAPLRFVSVVISYTALLALTNSFSLETYGIWMNIPYVAAILIGFTYFTRVRLDKLLLTLVALATSAFAVFKFIELAVTYASVLFFFFGLVFVALLLTGNVLFFRYLNRLGDGTDDHDGDRKAADSPKDEHRGTLFSKAVSTIVTIVGVGIGCISLFGIVLLFFPSDAQPYILYTLALAFIVSMIALTRFNLVVRHTLLIIGYAVGIVTIFWLDAFGWSILFLLAVIASWLRMEGRKQRFLSAGLINVTLGVILFQLLEPYSHVTEIIMLTLAIVNAVWFASHARLGNEELRRHVRESGLFFTLLALFWLTFMDSWFPFSYTLFNLLFFVASTVCLFWFIRRDQAMEAVISIVFWFSFLVVKYYDLLWKLLHKSITLALLGLLALLLTAWLAKRMHADEADESGGLFRQKRLWIGAIVLLQLLFIGYQTVSNESLLSNGSVVKLQIAPLDPRSLLQGDYVRLNYTISTPPDEVIAKLDEQDGTRRLQVVLQPDAKGVHTFDRLYASGETLAADEVVITGKWSGYRQVYYGIETYFVPEGTGTDVERSAAFAYVRVGASGNALLERLSEQ